MTGGTFEEKDSPPAGKDDTCDNDVLTKSHDQPAELLDGPVSSWTSSHEPVAAPRVMAYDTPAEDDTADIVDTSDDDDSTSEVQLAPVSLIQK